MGDVFSYPKWLDVLEELGLTPAESLNPQLEQPTDRGDSPAESIAHKRLKDYVAQYPKSVGLKKSLAPGDTEYVLRSGDRVDVFFQSTQCHIVVEVKSRISDESDLRRGFFQCVKYRAVLRACRNLEGETYEVDALLAMEGSLPDELIPVRNTLGVKVIENIQVKDNY